MWIGIGLVLALVFGLAYLGRFLSEKDAEKKRKRQQALADRRKELEDVARELEKNILEPLLASPNLLKGTEIKTSVILDPHLKGEPAYEADRIVVDFFFRGEKKDFDRVKETYVRSALLEILKENPTIRCPLNPHCN